MSRLRDMGMRTSLAEFVHIWDAHIVVVSSPELGADGHGGYTAEAMRTLEAIQRKMMCKHRDNFGIAVDFQGSTSIDWCNSRVRCVREDSTVLYGERDFDGLAGKPCFLDGYEAYDSETNEKDRKQLGIKHTYWYTYWRGKVCGALAQTLMTSDGVRICDEAALRETQGLYVAPPKENATQPSPIRVVVAASIDGGVICQTEKTLIPVICRDTLSDLRRRGFDWASDAHVVWCHFPCVEQLVRSLAGERNLTHDFDSEQIGTDDLGHPASFRHARPSYGRPPVAGLLICSVAEALHAAVDTSATNLVRAASDGDTETVRFLLERKASPDSQDSASGQPALMLAAQRGHAAVIRELVKYAADVSVRLPGGETALTFAVRTHAVEGVSALLDSRADPNQTVSDDYPVRVLEHVGRMVMLLAEQQSANAKSACALKDFTTISDLLARSGAEALSLPDNLEDIFGEPVDMLTVHSSRAEIDGHYHLMRFAFDGYPVYVNLARGTYLRHAASTNEWLFTRQLGKSNDGFKRCKSHTLNILTINPASWLDQVPDADFRYEPKDQMKCGGFIDFDFPPFSEKTLGIPVHMSVQWRRAPEMIVSYAAALFGDLKPTSLKRGRVEGGDTSILAALAGLSLQPECCTRLIQQQKLCTSGRYDVSIYDVVEKQWKTITVDDIIPCSSDGPWFARRVMSISIVTPSTNIWPMIIEKALAKFHGSYWGLRGGQPEGAFMTLAGFDEAFRCVRRESGSAWDELRVVAGSSVKELQTTTIRQDMPLNELWTRVSSALSAGSLATFSASDDSCDLKGLCARQTYAILAALELPVGELTFRLVQLYNPLGIDADACWTGDWGIKSSAWEQYPSVRSYLENAGYINDDDREGLFWMSFEDAARISCAIALSPPLCESQPPVETF